jgi:SAM-dependent methyltransferase
VGTGNAGARRKRSYFFEKYCQGKGIDIGCHNSKVLPDADGFDKQDFPGVIRGDATFMEAVADESYDWVYSSHCLEHLENVHTGLRNWWRILKNAGYLILFVPHRDYYEQKRTLPSQFNKSHFRYFLPFEADPPDTFSLYELIRETMVDGSIVYIKECSDYQPVHRVGEVLHHGPRVAPSEWSIEAVIQKGPLLPIFERNYE